MKGMPPAATSWGNGHPSRLQLTGLLAGEIDAATRTALEEHFTTCPRCSREYALARGQTEAFSAKYPDLDRFMAARGSRWPLRPESRASAFIGRFREWLAGLPGWQPALAGVLFLAVAGGILRNRPSGTEGDLTAKGATGFYLFRNGMRVDGDSLACLPGDTLQLGLVGARPVYFAVLYRDDGGGVRVYMAGAERPAGNPGGENLPKALILDSTWSRETLYCLWAEKPIRVQEAQAWLGAGGDAGAASQPPGLHLRVYLLINPRR